jgi:hypothetical protein
MDHESELNLRKVRVSDRGAVFTTPPMYARGERASGRERSAREEYACLRRKLAKMPVCSRSSSPGWVWLEGAAK